MRFVARFKEQVIQSLLRLITRRERERIKRRLSEIAPEIIEDMNRELESRKKPGASPPQYMRRNPEWVHYPIEKAWEWSIEDKGLKISLHIRNFSQHFLAVEFGVPHEIRPTHADYLVWDTATGEVRRKPSVEIKWDRNKGFVEATVARWRNKIPLLLKK